MEFSWYIKYPPQSLGSIKLDSDYTLRVRNVSWYLDNDIHLDIYEDVLPSPISDYSPYDLDPFDLFNKLYYVLHKIIMYADDRIFVRDYLTAFTVSDFIHPNIEEKIFFLQALKKIILHFEEELWIPAPIIKSINILITDLSRISNEKREDSKENTTDIIYKDIDLDEYITTLKNTNQEVNNSSSPIAHAGENAKKIQSTKKTIEEHFDSLCSNKGWKYAFRNETDKEIIVGLLVLFFTENDEIEFPKEEIKLRLKTKTKVARVIKSMYQDLGKRELKKESTLFKIMCCMDQFSNQEHDSIYKLMNK